MIKNSLVLSVALVASATSVFAADHSYQALLNQGLRVDGSIPHKITLANHQTKIIRLMNVTLSPNVAKQVSERLTDILQNPFQRGALTLKGQDLPAAKYLGMNGEQVLDQGEWGTCATFATTGAINAMLSLSGDAEVSQLCNLELSKTLDGGDGAWDGSFGYLVFGQINQYGFINKQYQHATGCGRLKSYPAYSPDDGSAMTAALFTAHSALSFDQTDWTPIVSYDGSFAPITPAQATVALSNVKAAINQGYRVVFGSLIDGNVGQVGAAGQYDNIANDTWVMTTQIQQDFQNNNPMEGHEIIIDGYDDNACATYLDGTSTNQQCGLLRIRNSWNTGAGDQGDYYMTYDHFKGMVVEAYAIGQDVKDNFKPISK
ncbi:MAG: hypothetical protein A3F13_08485 [Gammaproteobacteria bacterium RIFCSPHIGHO2_12_FULL_40_19]|nr:MAG: hypothetical protein A3F13_08485 [Gammaproteobacteria bacterium RIFCSPHIGHO2_12_FULL_40_19]